MVQSIKTEVIYYQLPTDFEFEFNLCGCCQMRLLKEAVSDNSSLLKALQRSISRSRVIIIVGNVFGEENIISLISKAIGYKCEPLDTSMFDIKHGESISIIKDSVPLITDDGTFGGCIIESGPQSMIFLSDDKKVRKEIMNSLVHAYLADLSRYPVQAVTNSQETAVPAVVEPEVPTENDTMDEPQDVIADELAEESQAVSEETPLENETVSDGTTEAAPTEFEDFSTYSEPASTVAEDDPYKIENLTMSNEVDIPAEPQNAEPDQYADEYYEAPKEHKKGKGLNIAMLVLSVILLSLLAFIVYSFIYLPLSNGITITQNFNNVFGFLKGV